MKIKDIPTGREFDFSFEDDFIVKESNDFIATIEKDINSKMEDGVFECAKEIGFVMNKQKIIETLEKGIAQRPLVDDKLSSLATIFICPTCDKTLSYRRPNYCKNCGQKLDWSVEEEDDGHGGYNYDDEED